jgi:regulator of protease activity HflC (stomatin/prohibitin superfamily)
VLLPPEDLLLLVAEIERHRERVGPVVADLTLEILTLRDEVRAARGDRDRWFQAEARARADVEAEVAHALAEERSERDATAPMRVEAL